MPYGQVLVDTVKDSLNNVLAPASAVFRNRIINGAMVIDQRNAGASVATTTANKFITDRWQTLVSADSKFTAQQSTTAPVGFSNSLLATSSAATTVASGDYYFIRQAIEGFNTADLNWGTANAKTVTLSFQVYSSLTGTFGGALGNSAQDRSYPFSYTVSAANTWTQISITIAGDTTGTWVGATNGIGMRINFSLGMGSTYSGTAGAWASAYYLSATGATSVVGTNGATFYITGVQLEVGTNATSFDYRPYGTELALCQRYYQVFSNASGGNVPFTSGIIYSTTAALMPIKLTTTMRASPTGILTAGSTFNVVSSASFAVSPTGITADVLTPDAARLNSTFTGGTAGQAGYLQSNSGSTTSISFSAEL